MTLFESSPKHCFSSSSMGEIVVDGKKRKQLEWVRGSLFPSKYSRNHSSNRSILKGEKDKQIENRSLLTRDDEVKKNLFEMQKTDESIPLIFHQVLKNKAS